ARVPEADQFLSGLRRGVDAQGGAVRLGIVDADTQQRVAGALRVQQLPTLLLLIQGQLQPIVQSVIPDAEIDNLLTQVVEVARQQGMELPEGEAASQEPQEEPLPPLIAEAHEAIERGDLDAAVASYEKHRPGSPADASRTRRRRAWPRSPSCAVPRTPISRPPGRPRPSIPTIWMRSCWSPISTCSEATSTTHSRACSSSCGARTRRRRTPCARVCSSCSRWPGPATRAWPRPASAWRTSCS